MTSRPILFSGAMVRAILAGRKTQTRRVVKPQPTDPFTDRPLSAGARPESLPRCPFGAPGDRLWVRETWAPCEAKVRKGHVQYAADGAVGHHVTTNGGARWWERSGHTMGVADGGLQGVWVSEPERWRPSIHMPRWASRLTLEVTGVRVERLQDISEADAMAEGAKRWDELPSVHPYGQDARWSMEAPTSTEQCLGTARAAFSNYWNKCAGGKRWNLLPQSEWPWAANPWVWVVEFRRVET